ncbi:ABC-type Fe3+ transport system permease subunit [Chryseobacterium ginsenosidimutans]|uniref:hypothetical protein n=1 Tax=Chryseobacterium ginsenosidimutans TaxID=687846 RepID=UPI00216771A5|nr:hypothetical protein [Chryseobacterium ginsenosidimutans]MCS3867446.1 ABC-type Fe3+ transport system permease subunit [Chryseobacterium ginsenosidimutans]
MKPLILLEVGNLDGLVVIIILIILFVALSLSFMLTTIIKVWYEWKDDKKFSRKQFIQTMIISLLICGLISGVICGGL